MPLMPTFTITPRDFQYDDSLAEPPFIAILNTLFFSTAFGVESGDDDRFKGQYAANHVLFNEDCAGDPTANYAQWDTLKRIPQIYFDWSYSNLCPGKQLALIFSYKAIKKSRILVMSDAGILGDETLEPGDGQFLIVVEHPQFPTCLHFVYVCNQDGSPGFWYFKGITGYVI
jgi:hypothetical protein